MGMEISIVRLKSGVSLDFVSFPRVLQIFDAIENSLELAKLIATEFLTLFRDVDPETAMAADGRGALDSKAHRYGIVRLGRQINVLALDLRRAIIIQRQ